MKVYFDNAATTPLDPQVFEEMKPYLLNHFGNPSSQHAHGREARTAIESSRKKVAALLGAATGEIFFTSGGTEADNTVICSTINNYNISHVISSKIEHHAVLHTLENLKKKGNIDLSYVGLDEKGHIDFDHFEELLKKHPKSLVSLMHGNNEIGNLSDIKRIGDICEEYGALFHSDTVQTMGHYRHDLTSLNVHCLVGSAHKFNGPKGIGFMYVSKKNKIPPLLHGGAQERNMRGGTENIYGIVGLAKALEIAYQNMDNHKKHIEGLKKRMIARLQEQVGGVSFNGDSSNLDKSLYTVLNVSLPISENNDMLLFHLDLNGISASGGSACSSGAATGSHVLSALNTDPRRGAVRFSFGKYNTAEEVDYVADIVSNQYAEKSY